jgi:cytochrome c-type biogenesis protein CcmF
LNDSVTLNAAPTWALWTGELGRSLVIIGAISFILAFVLSIFKREKWASRLFIFGSATLLSTFLCLASLFVKNQFEFQYVFEHADKLTDFKYKVAGVWSGQQGSFLLWACTSAIFGVLALRSTGIYRRWYVASYSVFLASLCGILAYETPFNLLENVRVAGHVIVPDTGVGLNASLQNYWVVIHPPTIFVGFGSLTVLFCFVVSAMLTKNLVDWARMVRPWALLSIAVLGLGIAMGGLWAYETLGWGGFWAWDPVENASFVPWLLTVAFVHGLIVMVTKGKWIPSTLLLGGLPFLSFVYGTFLTRSGFLSEASVHSFAQMNRSALWILLGVLVVGFVGFFALWLLKGLRQGKAAGTNSSNELNRESFYKLGMTLLSLFGLAVAIGMSVPMIMSLANKPTKVVSEGLYHLVVGWFFVPIIFLVAVGPFVSWRNLGSGLFWARIFNVFCVSIGLTGVALLAFRWPKIGMNIDPTGRIAMPLGASVPLWAWMGFLTFLCIFALISNTWRIAELSKRSNIFSWGGFVSHIGVAVLMAGLLLSRGFERKEQVLAQRGEPITAMGYVLTPGNWVGKSLDDRDGKLQVEVANADGVKFTATPGLYWLPDQDGKQQTMRWPYIRHSFSHDLYLALANPIMKVWETPIVMSPGKIESDGTFFLKYDGFKMEGKPGETGTRFVADVTLQNEGQTYHANPGLTITPNGLQDELVDLGPLFYVSMSSIDAGSKSASLQLFLKKPIYPMELYYKPLTSLVWLGTGILFLGGLMAAFYRRPRPSSGEFDVEDASAVEELESKEDALVSAP